MTDKVIYFRSQQSFAEVSGVDRDSETIKGVALLKVGEINPIDDRKFFVDETTVDQFVALVAASDKSLRARYTHGDSTDEGLGTYLGRWKAVRRDGDVARMDLQLSPRSHESPKGDLGKYVLDMAESDPDMFGASMLSSLNAAAMMKERREDGYMPIRLKSVFGADIVDTPALVASLFAAGANPHDLKEFDMADQPAGISQEQFDAGLKKLGETLSEAIMADVNKTIDAKFAAQKAPESDEQPTADELRKQGAKTASQIMAFAAESGLKDYEKLAKEAIDKGVSVESFKASLADRMIEQNALTKDDGEKEADPHAKFRAEFRSGRDEFAKFGIIDEDAYVRSRCRDEGLPVPAVKQAG